MTDQDYSYVDKLLKQRPDIDEGEFRRFAHKNARYKVRSIYNLDKDEIDRLVRVWDSSYRKLGEMRMSNKAQRWGKRLNEINVKFGISSDKLQDYVNILHKGVKTLDKEEIDSIGHKKYDERTDYENTDPLKMAQKKMKNRKTFITHFEK